MMQSEAKSTLSLQNVMNNMARQCSISACVSPSEEGPRRLSEIEAFATFDDLLAVLRKEYLSAKEHRQAMPNTPDYQAMLDMAMDVEDSAWCAMQTRFLELREDTILVRRIQKMIRERELAIAAYQEEQEHQDKQREQERMVQAMQQYLRISKAIKEQNRVPKILEWLVLFLIFYIPITGAKKIRPFERMAV